MQSLSWALQFAILGAVLLVGFAPIVSAVALSPPDIPEQFETSMTEYTMPSHQVCFCQWVGVGADSQANTPTVPISCCRSVSPNGCML